MDSRKKQSPESLELFTKEEEPVRYSVRGGLLLLVASFAVAPIVAGVPPAKAITANGPRCEECDQQWFVWYWKHGFPYPDGDYNCDSGDCGCHGTDYKAGTCDEKHTQFGCLPIDELNLNKDAFFSLLEDREQLGSAGKFVDHGVIAVDSDANLVALKGCTGGIVASVRLAPARLILLTGAE